MVKDILKNGNLLIICNIPGHNRSPIERNDLEEKTDSLNIFNT